MSQTNNQTRQNQKKPNNNKKQNQKTQIKSNKQKNPTKTKNKTPIQRKDLETIVFAEYRKSKF